MLSIIDGPRPEVSGSAHGYLGYYQVACAPMPSLCQPMSCTMFHFGPRCHCAAAVTAPPLTRWLMHTGRSRIKLKSTGEVFTINPCNVKANNVIVGGTWVDNEGDYALINTTTGARADMYFTPCGWWGNGRYQVRHSAS